MNGLFISVVVLIFGIFIGYVLGVGYYAGLVRAAFGLGDEVKVRGWLRVKAIKRRIDSLTTELKQNNVPSADHRWRDLAEQSGAMRALLEDMLRHED